MVINMAVEKNEQYWTRKANIGLEWLNVNEAGPLGDVLENTLNLLKAQADDPVMADALWVSIRSMAKNLPNTFIQRGRQNSLDPAISAGVASVVNRVSAAFAPVCEELFEMLETCIRPHGRTGGSYADSDAMAAAFGDRAESYLMTAMKDGRWDGQFDENGLPVGVTPVVPKNGGNSEE